MEEQPQSQPPAPVPRSPALAESIRKVSGSHRFPTFAEFMRKADEIIRNPDPED